MDSSTDIGKTSVKSKSQERNVAFNRNITHAVLLRESGDSRCQNQLASEFQIAAEEQLILKNLKDTKCSLPDVPRSTYLMVFSPDGKKMASSHGNHNVYVTDLKTGKNLNTLSGHPRTPWCIAFHPSSNQILASGCLGGQVRVWDLHGGSEIWTVEGQTSIASLAFHPTDRLLVIASYNELLFWDWSQPEPFAKCNTLHDKEKVRYVAFDYSGTKLITGIESPQPLQSQWDRRGPVTHMSRPGGLSGTGGLGPDANSPRGPPRGSGVPNAPITPGSSRIPINPSPSSSSRNSDSSSARMRVAPYSPEGSGTSRVPVSSSPPFSNSRITDSLAGFPTSYRGGVHHGFGPTFHRTAPGPPSSNNHSTPSRPQLSPNVQDRNSVATVAAQGLDRNTVSFASFSSFSPAPSPSLTIVGTGRNLLYRDTTNTGDEFGRLRAAIRNTRREYHLLFDQDDQQDETSAPHNIQSLSGAVHPHVPHHAHHHNIQNTFHQNLVPTVHLSHYHHVPPEVAASHNAQLAAMVDGSRALLLRASSFGNGLPMPPNERFVDTRPPSGEVDREESVLRQQELNQESHRHLQAPQENNHTTVPYQMSFRERVSDRTQPPVHHMPSHQPLPPTMPSRPRSYPLPPRHPPQLAPPQLAPPQLVRPRYVPPQHVPPQYVPPQYVPPQHIPPQHVPPQHVPPQRIRPYEQRPNSSSTLIFSPRFHVFPRVTPSAALLNRINTLNDGVRQSLHALINHINCMQQCVRCQPRMDGLRLGHIRRLWEELQGQIRTLQMNIWENAGLATNSWHRHSFEAITQMLSQMTPQNPNSRDSTSSTETTSTGSNNQQSETLSGCSSGVQQSKLSGLKHNRKKPSGMSGVCSHSGVNPPVTQSTTVTLSNTAPSTSSSAAEVLSSSSHFPTNSQRSTSMCSRSVSGASPQATTSASATVGREVLQITWVDHTTRGITVGVVSQPCSSGQSSGVCTRRQSAVSPQIEASGRLLRNRRVNIFANSTTVPTSHPSSMGSLSFSNELIPSQPLPSFENASESHETVPTSQHDSLRSPLQRALNCQPSVSLRARGIAHTITSAIRRTTRSLGRVEVEQVPDDSAVLKCRVSVNRPRYRHPRTRQATASTSSRNLRLRGRRTLFEVTVNKSVTNAEESTSSNEHHLQTSVPDRAQGNMLLRILRSLRRAAALTGPSHHSSLRTEEHPSEVQPEIQQQQGHVYQHVNPTETEHSLGAEEQQSVEVREQQPHPSGHNQRTDQRGQQRRTSERQNLIEQDERVRPPGVRRWTQYSTRHGDVLHIRKSRPGQADNAVRDGLQRIQRTGGTLSVVQDGMLTEELARQLQRLNTNQQEQEVQLQFHQSRLRAELSNPSLVDLRQHLQLLLQTQQRRFGRCTLCGESVYLSNHFRQRFLRQEQQGQIRPRPRPRPPQPEQILNASVNSSGGERNESSRPLMISTGVQTDPTEDFQSPTGCTENAGEHISVQSDGSMHRPSTSTSSSQERSDSCSYFQTSQPDESIWMSPRSRYVPVSHLGINQVAENTTRRSVIVGPRSSFSSVVASPTTISPLSTSQQSGSELSSNTVSPSTSCSTLNSSPSEQPMNYLSVSQANLTVKSIGTNTILTSLRPSTTSSSLPSTSAACSWSSSDNNRPSTLSVASTSMQSPSSLSTNPQQSSEISEISSSVLSSTPSSSRSHERSGNIPSSSIQEEHRGSRGQNVKTRKKRSTCKKQKKKKTSSGRIAEHTNSKVNRKRRAEDGEERTSAPPNQKPRCSMSSTEGNERSASSQPGENLLEPTFTRQLEAITGRLDHLLLLQRNAMEPPQRSSDESEESPLRNVGDLTNNVEGVPRNALDITSRSLTRVMESLTRHVQMAQRARGLQHGCENNHEQTAEYPTNAADAASRFMLLDETRRRAQCILNIMLDSLSTFFRDEEPSDRLPDSFLLHNFQSMSAAFWRLQGLYMLLHLALELTDLLLSHAISSYQSNDPGDVSNSSGPHCSCSNPNIAPPFSRLSMRPLSTLTRTVRPQRNAQSSQDSPRVNSSITNMSVNSGTSNIPSTHTVNRSSLHQGATNNSNSSNFPIYGHSRIMSSASSATNPSANGLHSNNSPGRMHVSNVRPWLQVPSSGTVRNENGPQQIITSRATPGTSTEQNGILRVENTEDDSVHHPSAEQTSNANTLTVSPVAHQTPPHISGRINLTENVNNESHHHMNNESNAVPRVAVPTVQVNDVPIPEVNDWSEQRPFYQPSVATIYSSHRSGVSIALSHPRPYVQSFPPPPRPFRFRPRLLHPQYETEYAGHPPLYPYDFTRSAGPFVREPYLVAEENRIHRLQLWDFSKGNIPDIKQADKNVVVAECKIHNDASVDISADGHLLVALIPSSRTFPQPHLLSPYLGQSVGVYSLLWESLGQLLYTTNLEQAAVSVALSPTAAHLLVGLAAQRTLIMPTEHSLVAHIFRLEGARPGRPIGARGRLNLLRDIEIQRHNVPISLNCIRWAPVPGQGIVYGTNTGQVKILH